MAKLYDLARMTTATTGTGIITLGSAVSPLLSFAGAGVANGDIVEYAISDGSNSEIGTGTYTSSGTTLTRNITKSTNSNAAISLSGTAQVFISPRAERLPIPRSYLAGLTLSTAGSSATFAVAAGQAADSTNLEILNLASSTSKTTSAWAVGSGNGSLDTGTIANSTWYHAYLIYRPDTQIVDVLTSLSASAPTMPSSYTLARRIGSMKTDGSAHWILFKQLGDEFLWDVNIADLSNFTGSTAIQTQTLTVPTGVQVGAIINLVTGATSNSARAWVFSPDINSGAALASVNQNLNVGVFNVSVNTGLHATMTVRTNTSAQVKFALQTTGDNLGIGTTGWIDSRGKLN